VLSTIIFFALGFVLLSTMALRSPMLDETLGYPPITTGGMTIPRGVGIVGAFMLMTAESQMHMASAAVGVATANLYPHIELSASLAQAASGNGGAALWGFAAGLTAPIFSGGTLKAERQAAVDGYKATLAGYQQTVIKSFGQVADTLQAINHDAEEKLAQDDALRAAETSFRLNQQAYAQGENSILQVLEAERAYERALLGQIRVTTAQYLDTV
jgi:outer membrane protein TolC